MKSILLCQGGNYGWPLVQGDEETKEAEVQKPLVNTGNVTWAPSGIAYLSQGPWQGSLLVAALKAQELIQLPLNRNGREVKSMNTWLDGEYGRLRDVIQTEDGTIYISTSNRDGRGGVPRSEDDKIIMLTPKETA